MKRSYFLTIFAIICLAASNSHAAGGDCITTYYKTKDAKCLDGMIDMLQRTKDPRIAESYTGFLAGIFKHYPDVREKLLKRDVSKTTKAVFVGNLYIAGLKDEAYDFAAKNGLQALSDKLKSGPIPTLDETKPVSNPAQNDIMIGAYMASGDTRYIERILENFKTLDDDKLKDSIRLGLLEGKFGAHMTPPGRKSNIVQNFCDKYKCKDKVNAPEFLHLLTVSSAFWALNSLSTKDEGIKKTYVEFFNKNKEQQKVIISEEAQFQNYMTLSILGAAKVEDKEITGMLEDYESLKFVDASRIKNIKGQQAK